MTEIQALKAKALARLDPYLGAEGIGKLLGIPRTTIQDVLSGKTWLHIDERWAVSLLSAAQPTPWQMKRITAENIARMTDGDISQAGSGIFNTHTVLRRAPKQERQARINAQLQRLNAARDLAILPELQADFDRIDAELDEQFQLDPA